MICQASSKCVCVCVGGGGGGVLCVSVGVRNRITIWALETSQLKRDVLFLTSTMWSMVIIVIWPLFRQMPANQKPLNRIEIFWYQFTPRKLLYHMVSLDLVKFGPHGLSVFLGHPVYSHANNVIIIFKTIASHLVIIGWTLYFTVQTYSYRTYNVNQTKWGLIDNRVAILKFISFRNYHIIGIMSEIKNC